MDDLEKMMSHQAWGASWGGWPPRHHLKGQSKKKWRQMRRDLNGAFGHHSNPDTVRDLKS